jgi:hypothetical protein
LTVIPPLLISHTPHRLTTRTRNTGVIDGRNLLSVVVTLLLHDVPKPYNTVCAMQVCELDPEHGAVALARLHAKPAAEQVHDLVDNCKAVPRALVTELAGLGLHEGLEEAVVDGIGGPDAGARVVHLEAEDKAALVLPHRGSALPSSASTARISLLYGWPWSSMCDSVAAGAGNEQQIWAGHPGV